MRFRSENVWARYGVAILSVTLAVVVRLVLKPLLGDDYPIATIFLAIVFSAWYGGFGPALLASFLGALASVYFLAPSSAIRAGANPWLGAAFYWGMSVAIALLGGMFRVARWRVARQLDQIYNEREQLRATLGSIGDAVIVTDHRGRITLLNAIAESMTGWTSASACGQLLGDVFHIINEQTRALVESPVDRVLREGLIVGLANHTVLITKDGSQRPIDDSAAPIRDNAGRLTGVVLVFRDVTERRRAEQALHQADRKKDDFLALLAHELRNPLAPIQSALQILQLPNVDAKTAGEAREVAERQLVHLTRLVDDLLDVSRIMRGKITLRKQPLELSAVVTRAVETIRPLIDSEKHELIVELPAEPITLDADVVRMSQALANLLSNAAKYTPSGGRIWLTANCENELAIVRVRDTGIGIDPETLPRLFDMFMQVAPGTTRSQGGLGIGLTLVKNLIEMHGGTVSVHSEGLGRGSEFSFQLPVLSAPAPAPAEPPRKAMEAPAVSRRLLVVDDNVDAAQSLAVLLRMYGHQVRVAHGGEDALAAVAAEAPELILLDIGMPGMNGYEVAINLRQRFRSDQLTLVALTGWGQEQDRRRTKDAGFDHHLTKPVELATLRKVLAKPGEGASLEVPTPRL